jgi:hypothetical protein
LVGGGGALLGGGGVGLRHHTSGLNRENSSSPFTLRWVSKQPDYLRRAARYRSISAAALRAS